LTHQIIAHIKIPPNGYVNQKNSLKLSIRKYYTNERYIAENIYPIIYINKLRYTVVFSPLPHTGKQ